MEHLTGLHVGQFKEFKEPLKNLNAAPVILKYIHTLLYLLGQN